MKSKKLVILILGVLLTAFAVGGVGCKNALLSQIEQDIKDEVDPGDVSKSFSVLDEGESRLLDDPEPRTDIPAPANVVVKGVGLTGDLTIEWSPVIKTGFDQTFYNIYKSLDGVLFERIREEHAATSYTDTDVDDGIVYYYAVKTLLKEQKGPVYKYYSSKYSFLAPGYTLGKVSGLNASYLDYTERIEISWKSVNSAHSYKIERKLLIDSDWADSWNVLNNIDNDLVIDQGGSVIQGEKYEYRVSAISAKGNVRQTSKAVTGLARLAAAPEQVKDVTIDVRPSYFRDAIFLQWGDVTATTGYNVYASKTTEKSDFTDPDDDSPASTGKSYCLDIITTAEEIAEIGSSKRYYKISALNEFGFEGQLSKLNPAKHYGYLLSGPDSMVPRIYNSEGMTKLSWTPVSGATSYLVMKSDSVVTSTTADSIATWYCQSSVEPFEWVDASAAITLENVATYKSYPELELIINSIPAAGEKVFYKVMSLNSNAMALVEPDGLLEEWKDLNPGIGGETISETTALPATPELWFSASSVISPVAAVKALALNNAGNIVIKMEVPDEFINLLPALNIKLKRTYRYGGGHQGYNATVDDRSTHVVLTSPDPAAVPFSKTIDLMTINEEDYPEFYTEGTLSYRDDLHDTDGGEKLFASWNKTHQNDGGGNPWYEKKESAIDGSTYGKVTDPDGSPAGHEWHYLKWDWVARKYMANSTLSGTAYERVNLLEAIRCDYSLEVTWKDSSIAVTDKIDSAVIYGYPALTPREFTSLAFFIREVTFYKIGLTFEDEIYSMGISADTSDRTVYGQISGSMSLWGGKFSLGDMAASANLKTSDDGISDFPGCNIKFNWSPLTLKFGAEARRSLNGNVLNLETPFVSGSLKMTADLYGGTYQHGVQGGDMRVTYDGYSNLSVQVTLCNEYGSSSGWQRAQGSSASNYDNRYTSIGWKYGSSSYPGFN